MPTPQGSPEDDTYVAGTRIETVQGRTGTLTGAVDLHRFPYVHSIPGRFTRSGRRRSRGRSPGSAQSTGSGTPGGIRRLTVER